MTAHLSPHQMGGLSTRQPQKPAPGGGRGQGKAATSPFAASDAGTRALLGGGCQETSHPASPWATAPAQKNAGVPSPQELHPLAPTPPQGELSQAQMSQDFPHLTLPPHPAFTPQEDRFLVGAVCK